MSLISLALGGIAILLAIIPFVYTQVLGVILGVTALVLGFLSRKHAKSVNQPSTWPNLGMTLGAIATIISLVLYITILSFGKKMGSSVVDQLGQESLHGEAFKSLLKGAIEKASVEDSDKPAQ